MIEVQGLNFTYTDGTQALFDITCSFPAEHVFAVMGDSGSGKTTLLNCLARFLTPQQGQIRLDGVDIQTLPETEFRRRLGVVFQRLHLFPHLTILQNMALAPRLLQLGKEDAVEADAMAMLERLAIADLAHAYPAQVSGGQAQRAAIARGLMLRPSYMLLDEPTSALDARTSEEFAGWLRELREETSFIVVTHDLLFAASAARHGVYMENGRIVRTGMVSELTEVQASS